MVIKWLNKLTDNELWSLAQKLGLDYKDCERWRSPPSTKNSVTFYVKTFDNYLHQRTAFLIIDDAHIINTNYNIDLESGTIALKSFLTKKFGAQYVYDTQERLQKIEKLKDIKREAQETIDEADSQLEKI